MKQGELIGGRFLLGRFVARGGMGDVYQADDQQTGKKVALKLLTQNDQKFVKRMGLEAKAISDLNHPAIVRYVGHDRTLDHGTYLAMEWIDGITLSERLKKRPLTIEESLKLAARVADGLGAAHARGMIHRDIKPLNLMLEGSDIERVRILDFGIVRMNDAQQITATGVGMGTPEYMAPEQAMGKKDVGATADVFSLGCVLFRCLAGRTAFGGKQVQAILAKIALVEAPPRVTDVRRDIPPLVDDLVATLMAYEPEARPADGRKAARLINNTIAALTEDTPAADVAAEFEITPSLTRRELHPVSIIFAEHEIAEAETLPSEVFDLEALAPPMPSVRSGAWANTVESSLEGIQVIRGPLDAERMLPSLRRSLSKFDARVEALLNGSVVAMLWGGAAATDLAERAARCALAIRRALPETSVGIATSRAPRDQRQALNPIIDAAAALVRPRSRHVHVDIATRDLLSSRFRVDEDGRGLRLVEEVGDDESARMRARPVLGRQTPCVGRKRIFRQLEALYGDAVDDTESHAVVLIGEAGVGKSRVLAELLSRLRVADTPPTLLTSSGDALRSSVPYGLVGRMLRRHWGIPDGETATATAALEALGPDNNNAEFLCELAGLKLPADHHPALKAARADPALMAQRQREAWAEWVRTRTQENPVLLVVDDLHWADPGSVELVGHALKELPEAPLMVLGLARPDVHNRFPKLGDLWSRQEIVLDQLKPKACEELIAAVMGEVDDNLRKQLVQRSAGNPFYLEELLRAAATGSLDRVPESVVASVQLRLHSLPEEARAVLRAASVFGQTFWTAGVEKLIAEELSDGTVTEWLATLSAEELVTPRGPSGRLAGQTEYIFQHDLVREAAYAMLTPDDRRVGHRLAGAWLQSAGEQDAVVLAEHFVGGGASDVALEWFEKAGEDALRNSGATEQVVALGHAAKLFRRAGEAAASAYRNEEAEQLFERALALYRPLDRRLAAETALALADLRSRVSDVQGIVSYLAQAEEYAEGSDALLVDVWLKRADFLWRQSEEGALTDARTLTEKAQQRAAALGAKELEARAWGMMALVLGCYESPEELDRALECAEAAVRLRRWAGDLHHSLWQLATIFLRRNDLERAARVFADALAAAANAGDELRVAHCHANLGLTSFRQGRVDEAVNHAEAALALYRQMSLVRYVQMGLLNLGTYKAEQGEAERAVQLVSESLALSEENWEVQVAGRETLAYLARWTGDELNAQAQLSEITEMCARVHAPQRQAVFLGLLAESYWADGKFGLGVDALEKAVEVAERVTLSHAFLMTRMGRYQEAEAFLEEAAEKQSDPDRRQLALLTLSRILWWSGRQKEALAFVERADRQARLTKQTRYMLPVEALHQSILARPEQALVALERGAGVCGTPTVADMTLDVLTGAVKHGGPVKAITQHLLTAIPRSKDAGIEFRLRYLASMLCAKDGDELGSARELRAAEQSFENLRNGLSDEYRDILASHPWAVDLAGKQKSR